jgi:hypothetical protein
MGTGRAATVMAAQALRQSADQLSAPVLVRSLHPRTDVCDHGNHRQRSDLARFTDYEGAVQSVMAVDTLLNGMVNQGMVSNASAGALRIADQSGLWRGA